MSELDNNKRYLILLAGQTDVDDFYESIETEFDTEVEVIEFLKIEALKLSIFEPLHALWVDDFQNDGMPVPAKDFLSGERKHPFDREVGA